MSSERSNTRSVSAWEQEKVDGIFGALKGKLLNVLITDEDTATRLAGQVALERRVKTYHGSVKEVVPKKDLFRAMDYLSSVKVRPPVQASDVIVRDLLHTGVDVIACDDLME